MLLSNMRRSRNFSSGGGGPGQSDKKKALTFFFLFCFSVLSLFYRSQMVNFKEIYYLSRFQRGSNNFQGGGGSNFFQGGFNYLFPIKTQITRFSRGVQTPCPPSGSTLVQRANNKGADQSVQMPRLVCNFVVPNPEDRFSCIEAHYDTGC